MVLAELGGKLRESLRTLTSSADVVTQKEIDSLLSDITRALIESDVNVKLVVQLRDSIQKKLQGLLQDSAKSARIQRELPKTIQRAVVDELVALLSPHQGGVKTHILKKGRSNVVLFVGLQGAGKTTSIAKYAQYYARQGFKVAMVCADTFRAGAFDQLKQNATKLRIPFYGSYTVADPVQIALDGVAQFRKSSYELIIVDTSGRHQQEVSLLEEMQEISSAVEPDQTILVMDATQGQAVYDQALAFSHTVDVGGVIITKLDGHAKGGGALSAVAATGAPVLFLGSGEHFDDLEVFDAQSFVSKLLGFGDMRGLLQAMKGGGDEKQQAELAEKMSKGQFTLRMMRQQFEKVLGMGPLSRIAGMMPGMPDYLVPKGGDQHATDRLRKFMVIMDSMNKAELDGKVDLHVRDDPNVESRILRIARGSGSHPNEVKMLLQAHRQFESMVSNMGKSGMLGKSGQKQQAQLQAQMRKNPNFINQRLNAMDPKMLAQMGGREQVANMMQQMAKGQGPGAPGAGGGMPDMSALSAMMGAAGGGMPDMSAMMGGGGGQMPDMGALNAMMGGGGGQMPDMGALNAMMGGGGGGGQMPMMGGDRGGGQMPDMGALNAMMGGGGGGAGGMDMAKMMQAMQSMGMGGPQQR